MKEFEFFLRKGDVKKQSPDKNLSKSSFKDSLERFEFSKSLLEKAKSKYVLENAYEAMREAADSLLYLEGFKSFSHEASIIYLARKGLNERDIMEFDRFRKIRNSIKYYGGDCDEADAKSAIEMAEKIIEKVKSMLEEDITDNENPKFKFLEDVAIADIAFEAYGKDYSELFENAANAIFNLTADLKTLNPKIKKEVKLENSKIDLLLYDFLSEILYIKDADGLIFCRCKVEIKEKSGKHFLNAVFEGDQINSRTQILENDIKAITMHMFKVEKTKNGFKAVVVADI